jgi:tetratricopeptide (TPR) repeat protein
MISNVRTKCAERAVALSLGLLISTASLAGQPTGILPSEEAVLSNFCRGAQTMRGATEESIARGKSLYGEAYWHIHHYCYAQIWMLRAERFPLGSWERRNNLAEALDDLDYVLDRMPENHFLRPEILTRKGKVLRMQGRTQAAITVLKNAIDQNPGYWRAFLELANCHEALNQRSETIAALRAGLKHSPDAKGLSKFLADLESSERGKVAGAANASVAGDGASRAAKEPVVR